MRVVNVFIINGRILSEKSSRNRYKKYKLYHLSPIKDEILTHMKPRIPDNDLTNLGHENNTTPRISFAPSIGKCLSALAMKLTNKSFRVYAIDYIPKGRYPSIKEVADSHLTNEYWVTEEVYPEYLGDIKVLKRKNRSMDDYSQKEVYNRSIEKLKSLHKHYENKHKYRTFQTPSTKQGYAYLEEWKWKWI